MLRYAILAISRLAAISALFLSSTATDAKTQRSYAAKAEFKRMNPCPATGERRGKCLGFEIDHAVPLKCGGADHHGNMQWLSVEQHKEKTRREASQCRK